MKWKTRHTLFAVQPTAAVARRKVGKTLNADALFALVRQDFRTVLDHRAGNRIPAR